MNTEEIRRYLAGDETLDLRGSEQGVHAGLDAYSSIASSRCLLLDDVLRAVVDGRMASVVAMPKVDWRPDTLGPAELRVANDRATAHMRAAEHDEEGDVAYVWHGVRLGLLIAAGQVTVQRLAAGEESRKSVEAINRRKSTR